uniref:Uncharacterized protein n=1 Tax=Opuntia streptacantha TaxID=393608 RepID=A0A7C9CNC3_OPUST
MAKIPISRRQASLHPLTAVRHRRLRRKPPPSAIFTAVEPHSQAFSVSLVQRRGNPPQPTITPPHSFSLLAIVIPLLVERPPHPLLLPQTLHLPPGPGLGPDPNSDPNATPTPGFPKPGGDILHQPQGGSEDI